MERQLDPAEQGSEEDAAEDDTHEENEGREWPANFGFSSRSQLVTPSPWTDLKGLV